MKNELLSAVAAIALLNGGFASAQNPPRHEGGPQPQIQQNAPAEELQQPKPSKPDGAVQQKAKPHGNEATPQGKAEPKGKAEPSPAPLAQPKHGPAATQNAQQPPEKQQQQQLQRREQPAAQQPGAQQKPTAQQPAQPTQPQAAQPGQTSRQQSASTGNVNLTVEQKTTIREKVVLAPNAPRVDRIDFNINVGVVVPRERVRLVPCTPVLVEIWPAWAGFLFFIYGAQIVIVNPGTFVIAAVIVI